MSQMVCPQRHVTWGDQENVLSGKLRLYETWVGHKNVVTREIVSDAIGFFYWMLITDCSPVSTS